jgi:hypothetical protein
MFPLRKYALDRAGQFLRKFPLKGFLIQAPQALYTLTGYGVILGTVMGMVTDTLYAVIRAPFSGAPQIFAPPPSDPVMKAARYIVQPPYHYTHGQLFTQEEHLLLLQADIVASWVLRENFTVGQIGDRIDDFLDSPVIDFQPWHPDSIRVLKETGWTAGSLSDQPVPGLSATSTYRETLNVLTERFEGWIQTIVGEYNNTAMAEYFFQTLLELGEQNLTWLNEGDKATRPIYFPEELAIARLFEYSIFPPVDPEPGDLGVYAARALALAQAAGKELPGFEEVRAAVIEVWGTFSTT